MVRGSDVAGMEVDSPWLMEGGARLLVNGVDVVPLVDAELNRRFPGRELRSASSPSELRDAWVAVEQAWAATLERVSTMPPGTVDASVGGEWSLAQTLRHLVMATDTWLGRAVLGLDEPYHPLGLPNDDHDTQAYDATAFTDVTPTYRARPLTPLSGQRGTNRSESRVACCAARTFRLVSGNHDRSTTTRSPWTTRTHSSTSWCWAAMAR